MELQTRTLEVVSTWRQQITDATRAASEGHIEGVLGRTDLSHPYIVKVMDVHPCMGKVAGRRILDELGIAHQTHLSRLTAAQVAAISQRCRCERG
ncbi:MAG: hypothetical protein RLZ48_1030 [Actinomycetota bacterium]|jgi:hypothetical protein|nr:hypothetical protein [Actinomycetota bacterium]